MLDNTTKMSPESIDFNKNNELNKSDTSRATTPNAVQSSKIVDANKSYSINLKPIMKYVSKNGSLIDTMKDQAAFNEKDLENRIG